MSNLYIDPSGEPCDLKEWRIIPLEKYQHEIFEDERIRAILLTKRYVSGVDMIPPEHWKRFRVAVDNIIRDDPVDGSFLVEPRYVSDVDATKEYRTFEEAKLAYITFLAKYSMSHFDEETGEFVEVGNKFAPPDPDKPVIKEDSPMKEEFGSW